MFQYRVGTYKAISELEGVDFELWHGKSVPGTKRKNYLGDVQFRHKELPTKYLKFLGGGPIGLPYTPFFFFRLVHYSPDVILTEGASNLLLAFIAFLYAKLFHKKIIWWSLGSLKDKKNKGVRLLLQRLISFIERHVDAVFTYSTQGEKYFLNEGVPQERIFKAVNVVNMQPKIEQLKAAGKQTKEEGFNVVFVGAITKEKRLEMLVDVIKHLSYQYKDVHLHIIGDGLYRHHLEEYVKQSASEVDIIFHGRVVDGLTVMLSRYQVMVLPGLGGLAIVDGMLASLPVISGPADGTELDLITKECGYVTDKPMTHDYLLTQLDLLHNSPELVLSMGEKGYQRITGELSFDNYMNILDRCINYAYEK